LGLLRFSSVHVVVKAAHSLLETSGEPKSRQQRLFGLAAADADHFYHQPKHLLGVKWFPNHLATRRLRACLARHAERADKSDRGRRPVCCDVSGEFMPVHAGELSFGENRVEMHGITPRCDGVLRRSSSVHLVAGALKKGAQKLSYLFLSIYNQKFGPLCVHQDLRAEEAGNCFSRSAQAGVVSLG
jgi:hypothetical protein